MLREKLAESTIVKNNLQRAREALLQEEQDLLETKDGLAKELKRGLSLFSSEEPPPSSSSSAKPKNQSTSSGRLLSQPKPTRQPSFSPFRAGFVEELVNRYSQVQEDYRMLLQLQKLWIHRYDSVKNIFIDIRPLNSFEKNGKFSKKSFPMQQLIDELSSILQRNIISDQELEQHSGFPRLDSESASGVSKPSVTSQGSEVLYDIQALMKNDYDLAEALKLLKGKESSLLTAFQDSDNTRVSTAAVSTLRKIPEEEQLRKDGEMEDPLAVEITEDTAVLGDEPNPEEEKDQEKDQNMIAWTVLKVRLL
jgi:hypothetical protein